MTTGHDIDTTLELDVRVDYTYKAAVEARINCDPDDGWPPEPAETEIQAVWLGHVDILAALPDHEIRRLEVLCESDGEKDNDRDGQALRGHPVA